MSPRCVSQRKELARLPTGLRDIGVVIDDSCPSCNGHCRYRTPVAIAVVQIMLWLLEAMCLR